MWGASRGCQALGAVFLSDCLVETPHQVPDTFWRVATPNGAKKSYLLTRNMLLILHTNALLTLPYKVWPASRGSQAPGVVFLSDCQVETPRQVPETFWRVATPNRAKKLIKLVEEKYA